MDDVQIAVIDEQQTQIALAVPGVQGAAGAGVAVGGTQNQLLVKQSGVDYDTAWSSDIDVPGTLDVTGDATFDQDVTIEGDLTVNGTTTTIDTQTLVVEDKNIEMGSVTTPTDVTADGGGITLKGTTDKTINWVDATDSWTSSEHVDLASGKSYRINNVEVLSATALGSSVLISSANVPANLLALDDLSDVDVTTTPPADGEALVWDNATSEWVPGSAGATAAGSANEIQYNDGASGLAASADLTWDDSAKELGVGGDINLDDGGTYSTTVQVVTPTANRTISFPDATGTLALVAGSSGQVLSNQAGALAGGNLSYDATAGTFGYGTGRGTVTQATNKSTGVTLNAPCGAITMNGAALSADTTVSFTLTNSSIAATDILLLNHISGGTAGSYVVNAQAAAGSASINVTNISTGSLSEAVVIGFAVIKA